MRTAVDIAEIDMRAAAAQRAGETASRESALHLYRKVGLDAAVHRRSGNLRVR